MKTKRAKSKEELIEVGQLEKQWWCGPALDPQSTRPRKRPADYGTSVRSGRAKLDPKPSIIYIDICIHITTRSQHFGRGAENQPEYVETCQHI